MKTASNVNRRKYRRARIRPSLVPFVVAAVVVVALWSWSDLEIDLAGIAGLPTRLGQFLERMNPPDWSVSGLVFEAMVETLQIAFLGTLFSVLVSLPLALLATAGNANKPVKIFYRWLLAAIRGLPLILLALLFVSTVGLGPTAGVLTIAVHSTGMLAKFYAESFENADRSSLEALELSGASTLQKTVYGLWPQVAPDLLRDTLFRFELNIRESLVLGLVGAGGIGFYIHLYARAFQYQRVAVLCIVTLAAVIAIEQLSAWLRSRLR